MRYCKKSLLALISLAFILPQFAFAIGSQHGTFRSQSTQGDQWMGTAVIEEEEFRITVHPNYLDVELDWTFRVGGTEPDEYSDALEIVGNLNLEKNSVIVGMLTWWKGDILKGKLKTKENARSDYEEVVQRDADAPPPPRDPVLIEYSWGIDNYDISIFPANFGDTRKVRIHYLIPASSVGGVVKVAYPHTFSRNSKVYVKAGPDVDSYEVETYNNSTTFQNKNLEALSSSDFSFGYSGTGERIQYIVPKLASEPEKSRIYSANYSNSNVDGQAAHIVVMDAKKAIAHSNLDEDFVILWRWNHSSIVEKYAGQIVKQSKLLKTFMDKLDSSSKRAALIIDKDNGERVQFSLSKKGDPEYQQMIAYLDSIAALTVKSPVSTTTHQSYDLKVNADQAVIDFETALNAAMNLFDQQDNLRHLLILTAGPQLIYDNYTNITTKLDSSINLTGFVKYAENFDLEQPIALQDREVYWPGLNLGHTLNQSAINYTINAVLSNGTQNCTLSVADIAQANRTEVEKHVFSTSDLSSTITWTISQDDKVLTSFEETAQVIAVDDSMAMMQIMGASRALTPMASSLPRSLAAAVGFIDSTYSLVALEEDKLSASEAILYEFAGVPDLLESDIHPGTDDLVNLSTSNWVDENGLQRIWSYSNGYRTYSNWAMIEMDENVVFAADMDFADGGEIVGGELAEGEALMPMPVANQITYSPTVSYDDYSEDVPLLVNETMSKPQLPPFAKILGSQLVLDLSILHLMNQGEATLSIYDLKGNLIYSTAFSTSSEHKTFELENLKLAGESGLYLIQVKSYGKKFHQGLMVQ